MRYVAIRDCEENTFKKGDVIHCTVTSRSGNLITGLVDNKEVDAWVGGRHGEIECIPVPDELENEPDEVIKFYFAL